MSASDISKELFADKPKLQIKARMLSPRITKQMVKEKVFPAYKWVEYTHQDSHNHYLICFYAPTVNSVNGLIVNYLAFLEEKNQQIVIQWGCWPYRKRGNLEAIATPAVSYYSRHFFDRYHERVWEKAEMNYNDILCRYFSRNPVPLPLKMNEKINRNYKKYGKYAEYAFKVEDGTCFIRSAIEGHEATIGQKDSDFASVVLYYTFVSEKMMSETQKAEIQKEGIKYILTQQSQLFEDMVNEKIVCQLNSGRNKH